MTIITSQNWMSSYGISWTQLGLDREVGSAFGLGKDR